MAWGPWDGGHMQIQTEKTKKSWKREGISGKKIIGRYSVKR